MVSLSHEQWEDKTGEKVFGRLLEMGLKNYEKKRESGGNLIGRKKLSGASWGQMSHLGSV